VPGINGCIGDEDDALCEFIGLFPRAPRHGWIVRRRRFTVILARFGFMGCSGSGG
jgi:hypothetical protein